jgi:hypothetical protein
LDKKSTEKDDLGTKKGKINWQFKENICALFDLQFSSSFLVFQTIHKITKRAIQYT